MTQPPILQYLMCAISRGNIRDVTSTQYLTASKSTVAGTVFHCKYLIRRNPAIRGVLCFRQKAEK